MKKSKLLSLSVASFMLAGSILSVTSCSLFSKDKDNVIKNEVVEISESDPWFDTTRVEVGKEFADMGLEYYYFNNAEIIDDKIILWVNGYYPYDESMYMGTITGTVNETGTIIESEAAISDEEDENAEEDEPIIKGKGSVQSNDTEDETTDEEEVVEDVESTEEPVVDDNETNEDAELVDEDEESFDDEYFDEDYIEKEYVDTSYSALVCYDMEGEQLWSTELNSYSSYDGDCYSGVESINVKDGKLIMMVGNYDYISGNTSYDYYNVDTTTGKISSTANVTSDTDKFSLEDDYTYMEGEYDLGSCVIVPYYSYSEDYMQCSYIVQIIKDGKADSIDLSDAVDGEVYGVSNVLKWSDSEALVIVWTDKEDTLIKIDIDSLNAEIIEMPEELKSLSNNLYNLIDIDGTLYVGDSAGLSKVDFKAGTQECIFSYNDCNVKLSEISYLQPYEISDDEFVFAGSCYDYTPLNTGNSYEYYCIYKFTKATSNPNAGKVLLSVATTSYLTDAECESIYQFNQNNDKYFLTYTAKYSSEKISYDYDTDNYDVMMMKASADMSNQLAMDLMAGEGPDIILDAASNSELNSSDYLVDLSEYVSKLSSEKYYINIFDAARTGEALYQLPLSFMCNALMGPEGISSNGLGFTYDEYLEAIDEYNDGVDPLGIDNGRLSIFTQLVQTLNTPLVDAEGKVNLRSDEFTALCEYCENLPELSRYEEDEDFMGSGYMYDSSYQLSTCYVYGVFDYLYNTLSKTDECQLYGLPSYNGSAPSAVIYSSVAISASCANVDGAWEFVETMLQDESMNKQGSLTVSKSNMQAQCDSALEQFNSQVESNLMWSTKQELMEYGMPYELATEADAQNAIAIIENINSLCSVDPEIVSIIVEEIQPYFAGQKSLDEVISIMEDKCQTVVDERG